MKILLLSPLIHAEHKIAKSLQKRGIAVLFAENRGEAWEILRLHGSSIDLAVIHREGKESEDSGLKLLEKVKAHPTLNTLPIILTTEKWTDAQCAAHQDGPQGVNAYLHYPFNDDELLALLGEILGPDQLPSGTVLEDSSQVFDELIPENGQQKISLIHPEDSILAELGEEPPDELPDGIKTVDLPSGEGNPIVALESGGNTVGTIAVGELPEQSPATVAIESSSEFIDPAQTKVVDVIETVATEALIPTMSLEENQPPAMSFALGTIALDSEATVAPGTVVLDSEATVAPGTVVLDSEATIAPGTQVLQDVELDALPLTGLSMPVQSLGVGEVEDENEPRALPISALPDLPVEEPQGLEENPPEMSYLFGETAKKPQQPPVFSPTLFLLNHPVGDALIPGGAAHSPDIEVMRKYLLLREQDVIALSNQLKESRDRMRVLEQMLSEERLKTNQFENQSQDRQQRIDHFESEKKVIIDSLETQIKELTFELRVRSDKVKVLENQMREKSDEINHLKERVRADIRKIRIREKELENKLEIMKKDSESLISSRETKIIELKRKLDLLEFNMDLLQDQYNREKEHSAKLKERVSQAAQIVRAAEGLLDSKRGGEAGSEMSGKPEQNQQKAS